MLSRRFRLYQTGQKAVQNRRLVLSAVLINSLPGEAVLSGDQTFKLPGDTARIPAANRQTGAFQECTPVNGSTRQLC